MSQGKYPSSSPLLAAVSCSAETGLGEGEVKATVELVFCTAVPSGWRAAGLVAAHEDFQDLSSALNGQICNSEHPSA